MNYNIYEKPPILISGCCYSVSAFTEQFVIKEMSNAHFNMMSIFGSRYNDTQLMDLMKWCSRYEIFLCIYGKIEHRYDMCFDCPIIYSTCVIDEPKLEEHKETADRCEEFVKQYGQYG